MHLEGIKAGQHHQKLRKAWDIFPLELSKKAWPLCCLNFRLLTSRTMTECIFVILSHLVYEYSSCYENPRKLIQVGWLQLSLPLCHLIRALWSYI